MPRPPQPFPYQGSKRSLSVAILPFLPSSFRLVEPFAGSAAITIATATEDRYQRFWLNDLNGPLANLWSTICDTPEDLADKYETLWNSQKDDPRDFYRAVRANFNEHHRPEDLLFVLYRCVKGAVRYNKAGEFNQSPDNRRRGSKPDAVRKKLTETSRILKGRTTITSEPYDRVLAECGVGDVVYLDPPYQGVSAVRDRRYISGVARDDLIDQLHGLNKRNVPYVLSYDGELGATSYGHSLPSSLNLEAFALDAGRSATATLLGRKDRTVESLYVSFECAAQLVFGDTYAEPFTFETD